MSAPAMRSWVDRLAGVLHFVEGAAIRLSMLLLIAHRGGFHDERWFSVPFGWGTEPLLDAMRISYETVTRTEDVRAAITGAVKSMNSMQAPVGVLLSGGTLF